MALDLTEFADDLKEIRGDLATNVTLSSGVYSCVVSSVNEARPMEDAGMLQQFDGVVVFVKSELGVNVPSIDDEAVINGITYRLATRLKDAWQAGITFAIKKQT